MCVPLACHAPLACHPLRCSNPFGLDHTLTTGVISGIGREINSGNTGRPIQDVIQTDGGWRAAGRADKAGVWHPPGTRVLTPLPPPSPS